MQAVLQAVARDLVMAIGGNGDDRRVRFAEYRPVVGERGDAKRLRAREIDIANARIEFSNGCVANLSASRVSQAPVRKLRIFQPDLYVSADLQAGKLRYVREAGGAIAETEETYEGGDALAEQAAAFVSAVKKGAAVPIDGRQGRRALELALTVGRLVRERLEKFI